MFKQFPKSLFLPLVFSIPNVLLANLVTYHIASPTAHGLELNYLWPTDGAVCISFDEAEAALEPTCAQIEKGVLMLLQVTVDQSGSRSQKTLRALWCTTES